MATHPTADVWLVDPANGFRDPQHRATRWLGASSRQFCELATSAATAVTATGSWLAQWQHADRVAQAAATAAIDSDPRFLTPHIARALWSGLPAGAALYVANSMAIREVDLFAGPRKAALRLLANRGVNGIDGQVSAALGAAAALRGPTMLWCGDLALLHDVSGLLAGRMQGADLTIVVSNDDGGGIFEYLPAARLVSRPVFDELFAVPHGLDLRELARGLGWDAVRVDSAAAFKRALARAIEGWATRHRGDGRSGCEYRVPRVALPARSRTAAAGACPVNGRALHFERRGHGPALVLLHGFTGHGQSMAEVAQSLEADYETFALDLPGHGHSVDVLATGGYGFDACVDDLAATLESAGRHRAHWLGYSMGARLALGCAVRHPGRVASLVLVGGRAGIADPVEREARRREDEALAARIESVGVETFVDEWLAQPMFASLRQRGARFLAEQRRQRLTSSARGLAGSLRRLGPGAQPPLFDALPRVDVPVLLVTGELDRKFAVLAHELAGRLPRAELCELPGAGHAAHLEQPEAFVHAVQDFLRRATAPAPSVHLRSVQETAS